MRLTGEPSFVRSVADCLDRRLEGGTSPPLAVAYSGGGDSLALLMAARDWALVHRRRLIALTVDHGLQPESKDWARACGLRCAELGVEHTVLSWVGAKPASGVAAAARRARHRLLAEAARLAGARVILMGHTADDLLEVREMRARGSSVSAPREWAPSPAWPEGRGVFLLRPMLSVRRAALRQALSAAGAAWIDDPANSDPASLRARVRPAVGRLADAPSDPSNSRNPILRRATADWSGHIAVAVTDLRAAPIGEVEAFLAAGMVCAGGSDRLPRSLAVSWIAALAREGAPFNATLTGAVIESDGSLVRLTRDAGRIALEPRPLRRGAPIVFDGRFELTPPEDGSTLVPAAGARTLLNRSDQRLLKALSPLARRSVPIAIGPDGAVCPPLRPDIWRCRNLVLERLAAACGEVQREATIERVGEIDFEPLNIDRPSKRPVHEPA